VLNMLIAPQNSPIADSMPQRLAHVRQELARAAHACGRNEDCITLVAISKGQAAAAVRELAHLGISHFGESYVQEAVPKLRLLADLPLTWHFVGRLQANKTRAVAENFAWVHSLDRLELAARLSAARPHFAPPLNLCLQVKLADDRGKGGVGPAEAEALAIGVARLPRLRLRGLMCILPAGLSATAQIAHFHRAQALLADLQRAGLELDTLSMGMSGDYVAAVQAGATLLRLGTALFGVRPGRPDSAPIPGAAAPSP